MISMGSISRCDSPDSWEYYLTSEAAAGLSPFNPGTWPKRWIPPSESTPRLASHGGLTPFFGPNSNYLFDRQHKNLPIADLPGPSRLDDAFDSFPNSILRHNDFKLYLGRKLE